jgi:TetR/AcrR family transcriptional regulator, regulator of biofilm formation and stress response
MADMASSGTATRTGYREGREALLDATVRVGAREGLRGLTYRAVGSESGMTHALVSYHFGSRENLIREAGRHASSKAVAGSRLSAAPASLDGLAADLPRTTSEHADVHAFLFELALEARRNPALRSEMVDRYVEYRSLTGEALAALGIEDREGALARLVFAAIDGLTLQQLLDGDEAATAAALEALRTLLRSRASAGPPSEHEPSPKRERPPDGREALLDATVRVVAEHGFDGLTWRAVAAEAGTTHSLVAYHFGTREALIHEAATMACRRAIASAALAPDSGRLEDFLDDLPASTERDLDIHLFQYEMALQARRRPDLGREIRALYEEYFAVTGHALEEAGIDAGADVARLAFAAIDGIVLQQVVFGDASGTQRSVEVLRDVLERLR